MGLTTSAGAGALLVPPVLNIGVTGHRGLDWSGERWAAIEKACIGLLGRIQEAAGKASAQAFFVQAPLRMNVFSMLAEGADQVLSAAAAARGMAIQAVLPTAVPVYAETVSGDEARNGFLSLLSRASGVTVLTGEQTSDRSFERANNFILAQADLLIAVWDGLSARGRGGTGDVVQSAVGRGIPVFVVEADPGRGVTCIQRPEEVLLPGNATDLPRVEAEGEIERVVSRILLPPASSRQREAFAAMLAEPERFRSWRFEYRLITWLGRAWRARPRRSDSSVDLWQDAESGGRGAGLDAALLPLRSAFERVDALANHYGALTRSSEASQFLLLALAAGLSVALAHFFPRLQPFASLLQIGVSGLILADATIGRNRRWYERWVDYRSLAERLRCMRFLSTGGQAILAARHLNRGATDSWTAWLAARWARSLAPVQGTFSDALVRTGYQQVQAEVADQIGYHRRLAATMTRLDRRLDCISKLSLAGVVVASIVQLASAFKTDLQALPAVAVVATLSTLATAALSSARGLRSSVNTAGTVRRSQAMVIKLARLLRRMKEHPASADRLAVSAAAAAALMIDDFGVWQTSLATRRAGKLRRPRLTQR